MAKFKPYSRRELNRRRRHWLRTHRLLLAGVIAGILLVAVILTVVIVATWPGNGLRGYVLGVLHASIAGITLYFVEAGFMAHDRQAIWHVRGAWGEENTRDELRRAKRRRLVWGWVDSITLERGDIDHVVVTRAGGLVVIDSKWRSEIDAESTSTMARDARLARDRAEGVARRWLKKEHGSHRARTSSFAVTPAVVIWGPRQHTVPDDAEVDGVRFVAGRQFLQWLRTLEGHEVQRDAALQLLKELEGFRKTAWRD